MTHAALAAVVWAATAALWARGAVGRGGGVAVFVLGTLLTFALEALVAAVQALRLEYYELFSRVFQGEGTPFEPWHVPTGRTRPTAPVRIIRRMREGGRAMRVRFAVLAALGGASSCWRRRS